MWGVLLYPLFFQVSDNHNGTHILKPKLLAELKVWEHMNQTLWYIPVTRVWVGRPGNETSVDGGLGMRLV